MPPSARETIAFAHGFAFRQRSTPQRAQTTGGACGNAAPQAEQNRTRATAAAYGPRVSERAACGRKVTVPGTGGPKRPNLDCGTGDDPPHRVELRLVDVRRLR